MVDPSHSSATSREPRTPYDLPRHVLDSLLEGCQVIDPEYRYLYVNDALVRQARRPREGLVGLTMMECYPGIDATPMFDVLRRCAAERSASILENEFTFPDGSRGWFELRFEPVPEGIAILSVDVTERKRAELALRRTLRALTTLSRCNQALIRAVDEQRFMDDVCQEIVEAGGYRAAWIDLSVPPGSSRTQRTASAGVGDGSPNLAEARSLPLEIALRGTSLGTLTICTDEADAFDPKERALLEEISLDLGHGLETLRARQAHAGTLAQLVAAQRLEAVGRLAGGVAHDFNNLLSVILTYSGLVIDQLHAADPIRGEIEQIHAAGQRAAALTRQLLAFSRKQILEPRITNLNSVIAGIENMLRRLVGEDVNIEVHSAHDLGNALADPGQLEQVIMNLAVNARDAMPGGGKLTIETANVDLDAEYAEAHISAKPGRYVRLSVADTGSGMTDEIKHRIFEPFFTTKEAGKGTGLGLSMVYGIIKQSGGNIWVYSEPGRGTTFKIYLPLVDAPVSRQRSVQPHAASGNNELILLVEDEPAVRRAAQRILEKAGYRVLAAGDANEALFLCSVTWSCRR